MAKSKRNRTAKRSVGSKGREKSATAKPSRQGKSRSRSGLYSASARSLRWRARWRHHHSRSGAKNRKGLRLCSASPHGRPTRHCPRPPLELPLQTITPRTPLRRKGAVLARTVLGRLVAAAWARTGAVAPVVLALPRCLPRSMSPPERSLQPIPSGGAALSFWHS
jgi:hypothetical protein